MFSALSSLENVDLFTGQGNYLVLSSGYNINWICNYQMQMYPFDTQICSMEFRSGRIIRD